MSEVRSEYTLANLFTVARVLLTPIFAVLWLDGNTHGALIVFIAAALTDVVDGALARFLDQRSRFGALLDPIADKVLMLTALCVGMVLGVIPIWLGGTIIARDALLVVAVSALYVFARDRHGPDRWKPTRIGKYATAMQNISVASAVGANYLASVWSYVGVIMMLAVVLTAIAGLQYAARSVVALTRQAQEGA